MLNNKLSNSKKGVELAMNTIIVGAILLIIMVILIVFFANKFGLFSDKVGDDIENTTDLDQDGVPDLFDPCEGVNPPVEDQKNDPACNSNWVKEYKEARS